VRLLPGKTGNREDGGWPERLCLEDRVSKNTWEVLSLLNAITAQRQLSSHEFLTPDRLVERTRFGERAIEVEVTLGKR
jgi:hypothetical protein